MNARDAPLSLGDATGQPRRLLGIFAPWRLQAYGYTLAALYAGVLAGLYFWGFWPVHTGGTPLFFDFTADVWLPGRQALHGHAALVYQSAKFVELQRAVLGSQPHYYTHWPYPPNYLLIAAPLAALPFVAAFFTYEIATLLACIAVVFAIVRRRPAIALVLASPFSAWNFLCGQTGFLTAALVGAALLVLERRPVLAGVFLGMLTYKPHFGILFPVALLAAREWRAIASAVATIAALAGLSAAIFGADVWRQFPHELFSQADMNLLGGFAGIGLAPSPWGLVQTVYGLVRTVHGGALLAGAMQAAVSCAMLVVVWRVWRSQARFALKAATLSAAMLLATPYALAYDMAAIAVPVAFLASDQIRWGVLRGEQVGLLASFAAGFLVFPMIGRAPLGVAMGLVLLCLALRRLRAWPSQPNSFAFNDNSTESLAAAES